MTSADTRARVDQFLNAPPAVPDPRELELLVVLGYRLAADGSPSLRLRRRVARAVDFARDGGHIPLLMSGGAVGRTPMTEAEVMARLAVEDGAPADTIVLENASASTVENVKFSTRLCRERGVRRIGVVTEQPHLKRASVLFQLTGAFDLVAPISAGTGGFRDRDRAATYRDAARLLA